MISCVWLTSELVALVSDVEKNVHGSSATA